MLSRSGMGKVNHSADTKPAKPAIKSSTLPRTSSQERDRLKPAPPPKPATLSPGQYDSRIYRDLQLTPEILVCVVIGFAKS
ncbi:hypothetical protein NQ317_017014 [Molorchus minor]|uniref:Uncharacterized protein n=1 Tax=Molorchus minor TaxID=1323400 RepID=A0ABQ9J0M4_9CUCU|nr:hypothetical protein NQ317_017014 [Molorchus minor]